ncbi:hypothetical protein F442_09273 [Phytophthora nicotianae P10297]|uniref:Uncharacterized protein n=3 Tax=Phytophthora nicotianae TaxID=4792 RepID=W2Q5U7_PHYN3|nr:hypothetical protein PPTG_12288 [Phytophthora nicotianae INRA-310]ETL39594.1 hypothetical protein L916_09083 [Phytophthora nicotianae]ETN08517.1 hypothetical protein PPTG_12288 [Phytophthora nicotianae INRA-310]ETP44098.1 hypothetical protein F442_09273 [Phytophthora nicotianae P10297]
MRLYASRFRALLVLIVAISAHRTAEASTCKTLLDSTSTFAKSLASWTETDLSSIDFPTVFKEINTALPWFSKCAAAIDPKAIYTSLASSSSVKSCFSALESFDGDLGTNDGWSSMCTITEDTIMPCVKSVMTNTIMDALDSTGGCCDDFNNEMNTLFGDSLDEFVIKLTELSANIACSERTFTNLKSVSTKEMCGYSIYNAFTFIQSDDEISSLMNLAEIPNDQMCNAFAGKAFTNTDGKSVTIGFGTNGVDTMGICLDPIDTFNQYMKSWGIFSETMNADGTTVSLSDLFTSGKSITGDVFFSYATTSTNLPLIGLRATDNVIKALGGGEDNETDTFLEDWFVDTLNGMKADAKSLNLHIPNNGDCSYSGQSITVPYEETSSAVTATSAASSIKLSGLMTAGVALLSTALLSAIL